MDFLVAKRHGFGPRQFLISCLNLQQFVSLSMHPLACFNAFIPDVPPETALIELPKPH